MTPRDPIRPAPPALACCLALLIASNGSCQQAEQAPSSPAEPAVTRDNPVLMTLSGVSVRRDAFEMFLARFQGTTEPASTPTTMDAAAQTALLNEFVEFRLLLDAAHREGIETQPEDRANLLGALGANDSGEAEVVIPDEEVLIHKLLATHLGDRIQVTEDEMQAYYNANAASFSSQQVYRVKEILVEDEALANQIRTELMDSRNRFGAFARQFSVAPSATNDGDLGYFRAGELPPEFEKIIFSLRAGRFSPVVQSQYGYHIFFLEEIVRAHSQKYFQVREQIRDTLRLEKERVARQDLVGRLYALRRPVIFTSALPFRPDRAVLDSRITLEGAHVQ